ncbi:MAG TPA: hypothetical protein VGX03_25950 [Candidatus Binatia bacterium]|jgi:hypothetical protein|nr:hypothetical protein [Candidatus Binatia bacterium]
MWDFMTQSGVASGVVDFTNDLSLLVSGLLSLVGVSAAMIVLVAIHYRLSQKTKPAAGTASAFPDKQKAA